MPRHSPLLPLTAALFAAAAAAQGPAPAPESLQAVQGTPAAPGSYPSPLAGYRAFQEETQLPWKEANDTVGRIGGWREYARESTPPASASQAPAAAAARPAASAPASPATREAAPAPATPAAPATPSGHDTHQH